MSDLIDRQAILKHIEKIRQSALMMDDTRRAGIIMQGMHLCEKAVRNQPSAQPEKRTEERTETHACDLIDREAAVDAIYHHFPSVSRTRARTMLHEVPSAQPEIKPIDYQDCANAMMKMWMDNVLTGGEYNRIMDKLNKHEMERRKADERSDL